MPRVPEALQAAFKAEAPVLRKTLKAIQRGLLGSQPDLATLRERIAAARVRLDYWETVLMEDDRHRIRSPVRLWDEWNRLRTLAGDIDGEMAFLSDAPAIADRPIGNVNGSRLIGSA